MSDKTMSGYALTPLAKADIFDVWTYIAEDSETAADRVEQAIYDACAFVAEAPMRVHTRPDLTTLTCVSGPCPVTPITPSCTGPTPRRCKSLPSCTATGTYGAF